MTPTLTRKVRLADIVTLAARVWNVPETAIKGGLRRRELVHARAAITAVARAMPTPISFTTIGKHLGQKDHSSACHSFHDLDVYARFDGFSEKLNELFHLCETEDPFVKDRGAALCLLPVHKPKPPGKKAKNDFSAPKDQKDAAHLFHDSISAGSIDFGAKLRAARIAA